MVAPLNVNWEAIRIEFSYGVPLQTLAQKYNVKFGTLAARSSREKWMQMRPETHAKAVKCVKTALIEGAQNAAQSLVERGRAYQSRVFDKTSKLMDAAKLAPPKTWKDAEIVDKIARRAAGLDTAETQINTIIGVSGFDESPVVEVETSHTPAILDAELE